MKYRFDKVYLEITNVCNLACSFCGLTRKERSFMSRENFIRALEGIEGQTKTLYFHVMGEPLLHPLLPEFLDLTEERGFSVNITTNATLLAERMQEITGKKSLGRLNLSVQSLEQFPEGERLERMAALIASVKTLTAAQRRVRPGFLASFRFWTRDDDTFSGPLVASLVKAFCREDGGEDSGESDSDITAAVLGGRNGYPLAPGIAIHAADSFEWPVSPPIADSPVTNARGFCNGFCNGFCRGLRDQIGILCDGTVVPCCLDRNGDIPLGNIFGETLAEIPAKTRAKALYDGFTARRVVEPLCRGCSYRTRFDR